MLKNLLNLAYTSPLTGDAGISPIFYILLILCSVIVIGCIVWAVLIGSKNSSKTKVITITDEDELSPTNSTVVEDITPEE